MVSGVGVYVSLFVLHSLECLVGTKTIIGIGFFLLNALYVFVFLFISLYNLDCVPLNVHFKEPLQNRRIQA